MKTHLYKIHKVKAFSALFNIRQANRTAFVINECVSFVGLFML